MAEFYLHHRYSEDIDLFTLDVNSFQAIVQDIPAIANEIGSTWSAGAVAENFRSVFFQRSSEPSLKIDLVREVGPQFGDKPHYDRWFVDAELNIAVNKVTALFGRAAEKDFADLYFMLRGKYTLEQLLPLAKEKDPGLIEFFFAGMLQRVAKLKSLPRMIQPLTLAELSAFFLPLAEQIMLKTKPPE